MGQMTYALMLGCKVPPAPNGLAWWDEGEVKVNGKWTPVPWVFAGKPNEGLAFDEEREAMGFWIAVGAGGERGVPHLEGPIDITTIEKEGPFAEACALARARWARYVAHAKSCGATLPDDPRLLVVQTEVA